MLKPKTLSISSSFKAWGFREGLSTGTDLIMTFDIPDGMTEEAVKEEVARRKFSMDVLAMNLELAKGTIPQELFDELKTRESDFLVKYIRGLHGPAPDTTTVSGK